MATEFVFPTIGGVRGPGFWLNPFSWIASRKKFRRDHTVEWRRRYEQESPGPPERVTDFRQLTGIQDRGAGFSFVILGDTGEGDRSQYGLLPLIRGLAPDFIIINGDVAYPAGSEEDFLEGFFQPYQNLRIPIWAVPGNHEYYSPHNGREFFDLFCTAKHASLWQAHGLRFIPQPGTYWELSSADCPLVVLALDSGMTATLDPTQKWLGFSKYEGDAAQLAWLERRLSVTEAHGKKALVLFHIPSLVNLERARAPKLERLHGVFGRFSSTITGIITAHEHGFQHYEPDEFARFVSGGMQPGPHYFVSGSGGAFLSPVEFEITRRRKDQFAARRVFPDKKQWNDYASRAKKAASRTGLARSPLARAINSFGGAFSDQDLAKYQSLLRVVVRPDAAGSLHAELIPYLQTKLEDLYFDQPNATVIVRDGQPLPTQEGMDRFTREQPDDPATRIRFTLAP
jgi:hypothetical protein